MTTCIGYIDGYIWLVEVNAIDHIHTAGLCYGNEFRIADGGSSPDPKFRAENFHFLNTDYINQTIYLPELTYSSETPMVNEEVTVTGFELPRLNKIESYIYYFGDGSTGEGKQVTHTNTMPGMYEVVVKEILGIGKV